MELAMDLSASRLLMFTTAAISGLTLIACGGASIADEAQEARPNRILFEYVPPQNPQLEAVYTQLKQGQALEKIQQLFSPFRIPIDLTVKTVECGKANAWYQHPTVTLCYEYMNEIWQNAPKQPGPAGVTPVDAVVGQFFYITAHEFGHAMFDVLQVPSFGSAEDAADEFSTFMMLHLGKEDARRLISGAAYSYRNAIQDSASIVALQAFSDMHSMPAQRFYNLLCIAYGADPTTFAYVVAEKYLPESRARDCKREYDEVAFAFKNLIGPHLDQGFVKEALHKDWLPAESSKPVGR
jgi:Putative metallopeptidase